MDALFDELVEELAQAEEFPTQAVRHCLSNPAQVVPGFLDLLREYAEDAEVIREIGERTGDSR